MDNPIMDTKPDDKPGASSANQSQEQKSPEEMEWDKLKGSTQDRIRELIKERNDLRQSLTKTPQFAPQPQTQYPVAPTQSDVQMTPEQQAAVQNLRKFGIVTRDDIQTLQDQLVLDNEYARLEGLYSGSDGEPRFDRVEIEDHMKRTGIYNPEKAYQDLYREELYDAQHKQQSTGSRSYSEKPRGSVGASTEPVTIDSIKARLSQPDGREWWEKNRERLLPMLGELMGQ